METGHWLPYYSDEGVEYQGILKELLDAFASAAQLKVEVQVLPAKRLVAYMVEGLLDMQLPDHPLWSPGEKAKAGLVYSDDVVELSVSGMFVLAGDPALNHPADIHNVGVPRGFSATSLSDSIQSGRLTLVDLPDSRSLLRSLLAHRIDSVYGDFRVLSAVLAGLDPKASLALVDAFPANRNFHYRASFAAKNSDLRDAFNRFLKTPRAKAIYGRYGLNP